MKRKNALECFVLLRAEHKKSTPIGRVVNAGAQNCLDASSLIRDGIEHIVFGEHGYAIVSLKKAIMCIAGKDSLQLANQREQWALATQRRRMEEQEKT